MVSTEIKIESDESNAQTCDHCGKKSNVFFIWGGSDCDYTIVLCPAHRNYYIEMVFVKLANRKANREIKAFHEKEKQRLAE